MSTILSSLNTLAWWFLNHPTATLWIVACLLGIAAGLVGIKLVRKDILSRMGLYKRQNGNYVFYRRVYRSARYQIKFFGGFTPRVVIRDGKQKTFRDPIKLKWVIPNEWEHNAYPHWEEPGQFERPFWTDGQDVVIGLREYRGRKSWAVGTKSLIGAIVVLALVFAGVTMFSSRGTAEKVEIQSITPVVQGTQRVNEPRPTATAVPTRPNEPVSVLVDTSKMPETNRDVWDWLNSHLPNLPAPRINVRVPDWFRALIGNSDGGAVITMQGLPGYVLILRDNDASVVVRLTEDMVPVTRTTVDVSNFTITAGDYHWKFSWDNTHWKQPVKGSHGKIEIIISDDDELTIKWIFSLLP